MKPKLRTGYSQAEKRKMRQRLRKTNSRMCHMQYFDWLSGFSVFNLYWGN